MRWWLRKGRLGRDLRRGWKFWSREMWRRGKDWRGWRVRCKGLKGCGDCLLQVDEIKSVGRKLAGVTELARLQNGIGVGHYLLRRKFRRLEQGEASNPPRDNGSPVGGHSIAHRHGVVPNGYLTPFHNGDRLGICAQLVWFARSLQKYAKGQSCYKACD